MRFLRWIVVTALLLTAAKSGMSADDYSKKVQQPVESAVSIRQETQRARDQWQSEKADGLARLEALQQRKARLEAKNRSAEAQLQRLRAKGDAARRRLAELSRFGQEMLPYLQRIHEDLTALLSADGPLLETERRRRLDRLGAALDDPELPIGEKFRRTMEALLIEAEYGSTIEVVTQPIALADGSRVARILRLGRVSLFFETLDGGQAGIYDPSTATWKPLADRHRRAIHTAVEIGSKRRPARLVALPVGRIVPP
jgi:hypothetical protein